MKKKRQETFNNTSANVPIIWRAPSFCRGSLCSGGRLRTWTQNTMVGSRTCFLFETTVWRSVAAAVTGETKSSKISVNKRQSFRLFKSTGLLKVQIWRKFVNATSIFCWVFKHMPSYSCARCYLTANLLTFKNIHSIKSLLIAFLLKKDWLLKFVCHMLVFSSIQESGYTYFLRNLLKFTCLSPFSCFQVRT